MPGLGLTELEVQRGDLVTKGGCLELECRAFGRDLLLVCHRGSQLSNQLHVSHQDDHQRKQKYHDDNGHDIGKRRPDAVLVGG